MDTLSTAAPESHSSALPAAEANSSAVSWPAIIAGTVVAAAASLVLLALGSGIGLASVSPWPGAGASAATFTAMAAIWLIVVQWVAAGLGGYLTGRLRSKWTGTHAHEVFFRDTAHGLVMWALATVLGAVLLASAASSAIGAGVRAAGTVTAGAAQGATNVAASAVTPYDVDMLFRSPNPDANSPASNANSEAARILGRIVTTGNMAAADRSYLTAMIAARTGISQADAQQRVDAVTAQVNAAELTAREAADATRKASAATSIYIALSLLIGAFIASAAAALGGRLRDAHP